MQSIVDIISKEDAVMKIEHRKAGLCVECGEKPVKALSKDRWCEFCEEAFQMEFIE